jgi:hypothetical protein
MVALLNILFLLRWHKTEVLEVVEVELALAKVLLDTLENQEVKAEVLFMVAAVAVVEAILLLLKQLLPSEAHLFTAAVVAVVVMAPELRVMPEHLYGVEMVQQAQQALLHLLPEQLPVAVRAVQKLETQAQAVTVQFASLTGKRTL